MAVIGSPDSAVGIQMLAALGLPTEKCTNLVVSFEPFNVVRATAEYAPDEADVSRIVEVVRELRRWA